MSIDAINVSLIKDERQILNKTNLMINQGEIVAIVGPNGAGKSSLLNVISGDIIPSEGTILYDKENINEISIQERAFTRSVMSQMQPLVFDFSVKEIIEMGWIDKGSIAFAENFNSAFSTICNDCKVERLLERKFNHLSGGEQRRVHFARTLLQLWRPSNSKDPKYLLLDEPTANLDLTYEILIMDIAKKITKNGVGVLIILHDLNLAAKYADKIMVLKDGNTLGAGLPGDVLNSELLTEAYDIKITIQNNPLRVHYY